MPYAAHRKGFTHRDLKPANVMLPKHVGLKLLEFGLAKQNAIGDNNLQEIALIPSIVYNPF
jgi:serine/threonine protein kinase